MKREEIQKGLLPSGYRQLEYIESTGTQWINTNVGNLPTVRLKTEVAYTDLSRQNAMGWGSSQYREVFRFDCYTNGFSYLFGDDSNTRFNATPIPDMDWHVWDLGPGSQKFDGVEYSQRTITRTGNTLYLFALHAQWTSALTSPCYCKMKYCIIERNNVSERHYLPALRISDSKPGLYDIINNQFYTNAGTGEFLYA